jgi:hypothetical protein
MSNASVMDSQVEAAEAFTDAQIAMKRSTVSGSGSTLPNTRNIRKWLREVIEARDIDSIIDAPCGDGRWMADVQFSGFYLGIDCVESVACTAHMRSPSREFRVRDLLAYTPLMRADLIVSRDFLVHLSLNNCGRFLFNVRDGGSKLTALTHFPAVTENTDIDGAWGWRPLNMTLAPFNLPEPIDICEENEGQGKTLALFRL